MGELVQRKQHRSITLLLAGLCLAPAAAAADGGWVLVETMRHPGKKLDQGTRYVVQTVEGKIVGNAYQLTCFESHAC